MSSEHRPLTGTHAPAQASTTHHLFLTWLAWRVELRRLRGVDPRRGRGVWGGEAGDPLWSFKAQEIAALAWALARCTSIRSSVIGAR